MPEFHKPKKKPTMIRCALCEGLGHAEIYKEVLDQYQREPMMFCPDCYAAHTMKCTECGELVGQRDGIRDISNGEAAKWDGLETMCVCCANHHCNHVEPYETAYCMVCGCVHRGTDRICKRHRDRYQVCPGCDEHAIIKGPRTIKLYDKKGDYDTVLEEICSECLEEKYNTCPICENLHRGVGEIKEVCGRCQEEAVQCPHCEVYTRKGKLKKLAEGGRVCYRCTRDYGGMCEKCGQYSLDLGRRYHHHKQENNNRLCCVCMGGTTIRNYAYKRKVKMYGKGPLYFGFENEYDFKDRAYVSPTKAIRKWVDVHKDLYHLMHDGSLRNGVELVSQPGSYEFWMDKEFLLPDHVTNHTKLQSIKTGEYGTAACHIHMSKDAFKVMHLYKFITFLANNYEKFGSVFKRGIGEYREELDLPYEELLRWKNRRKLNRYQKHAWLSLRPEKTIEIRAFVAAEVSNDMVINLQLLKSVYEYTRKGTPKSITWAGYESTLSNYPQLAERLKKHLEPEELGTCPRKLSRGKVRKAEKEARDGEIPDMPQVWGEPVLAGRRRGAGIAIPDVIANFDGLADDNF